MYTYIAIHMVTKSVPTWHFILEKMQIKQIMNNIETVEVQNDSFLLELLLKIGYFTGLLPYRLNNANHPISPWKKSAHILLQIILIPSTIKILQNHLVFIDYINDYESLLFLSLQVLLFITTETILIRVFYLSPKQWKRFFNLFQIIDLYFKNKPKVISSFKLLCLPLILYLVTLITFLLYHHIITYKDSDDWLVSLEFYVTFDVGYVCLTITLLFFINTLKYIKRRYRILNKNFRITVTRQIFEQTSSKQIVEEIRDAIKIYRYLSKLVESINAIFSWVLFTYISYTIVCILFCIYVPLYVEMEFTYIIAFIQLCIFDVVKTLIKWLRPCLLLIYLFICRRYLSS